MLPHLGGAILFPTLNMVSGYIRVPITEKAKAKTASCTPFVLFEFNRILFGLYNYPSTFQHLMEHIFSDQSFPSLLVYLNDIIIISSKFGEHLQGLELALGCLQEHNFRLKFLNN